MAKLGDRDRKNKKFKSILSFVGGQKSSLQEVEQRKIDIYAKELDKPLKIRNILISLVFIQVFIEILLVVKHGGL